MSTGPHLFHVDLRELKKLERSLTRLKEKALPFAARETINDLAFEAQRQWRQNIRQSMTLRNTWTERSIRVERAKSLHIQSMQSVVGSTEEYMREQEEGATLRMTGHEGIGIPAAAPGKRKTRGKVPKSKQLGAIQLLPRAKGNRRQKIFGAMALARKRGGAPYAFLQVRPGRKGIYQLHPGRKRSGIRKVWDLSKRQITKPRNPTMAQLERQIRPLGPGIYRSNLIKQLTFHHAFGY